MKIYKENKNWVVDGENDFTICHERDPRIYIEFSKDVKHFTVCNHNMCMLGANSKLKTLWLAIKFIFLKEAKSDGS